MITKDQFASIYTEIQESIQELFSKLDKNVKNNDLICFFADAEYFKPLENSSLNPYVIDYSRDIINDKNRLEFMSDFLNKNYRFKSDSTNDTLNSLTLELMIYSHIWESKPFLKTLKRLASLADLGELEWKVEIDDFGKQPFIKEIKELFNKNDFKIGSIISKGYNSSLRNAFAHSEYSFEYGKREIKLLNYKGKNWQINNLNFDDWTKKFCYSFLLSYELNDYKNKIRKDISNIYGTNEFEIQHPQKNGDKKIETIIFNSDLNQFNFKSKKSS